MGGGFNNQGPNTGSSNRQGGVWERSGGDGPWGNGAGGYANQPGGNSNFGQQQYGQTQGTWKPTAETGGGDPYSNPYGKRQNPGYGNPGMSINRDPSTLPGWGMPRPNLSGPVIGGQNVQDFMKDPATGFSTYQNWQQPLSRGMNAAMNVYGAMNGNRANPAFTQGYGPNAQAFLANPTQWMNQNRNVDYNTLSNNMKALVGAYTGLGYNRPQGYFPERAPNSLLGNNEQKWKADYLAYVNQPRGYYNSGEIVPIDDYETWLYNVRHPGLA